MQEIIDIVHKNHPLSSEGSTWIRVEQGCEMPDYDEYVLWLFEDGNMNVEALDKDGNPWIFGEEWMGTTLPKATHWRKLPELPKEEVEHSTTKPK